MSGRSDVAVVGGGIIGLATAGRLLERTHARVVVLEAEDGTAAHQTGHNSGVIHSGLYYKPGSLKATLCSAGRKALLEFCDRESIDYELRGKLVLAADASEIPALDELERRGRANGLEGVRRICADEIRELEPASRGIAGLLVPETGIIDYKRVVARMAERLPELGGEIRFGAKVTGVRKDAAGFVLESSAGDFGAGHLVGCAGLQSDRLAQAAGFSPDVRIVPFRGDYWRLRDERRGMIHRPVYPVPDPRFPFLGVHLTPRIDGSIEAGPNALLAWDRHGYEPPSIRLRDAWSTLTWPGTWKMATRYWRTGVEEMRRAMSRRNFARDLAKLIPEITAADIEPAGCGIRAQAVDRSGALVDDFRLAEDERAIHVLNAPSPGATASLAIGDWIASRAIAGWGLESRDSATGVRVSG